MPVSRKRKPSNYQSVRARKRRTPKILDERDAAVRAIYAAALPERQEYPPTLRGESKPTEKPWNKSREKARRVRQEDTRIDSYYRRAA
jgi:hypothetical protein